VILSPLSPLDSILEGLFLFLFPRR
jgi:uncharacterized protein YjeT (DUF2065 family)